MPTLSAFPLHTRPLTPNDSHAYRTLRTRILHSRDAMYFSDSYERERQLTEQQWLIWCTEKREHCILGTFDGDTLIGIAMVTRQGDTDSSLVELEAVWVDTRYRGTGLGKSVYAYARQWSQKQGYKFIAAFIRATNVPSLEICMGMGFTYAYTIQDEFWADGSVADTHAYLLDIRLEANKHILEPVHLRFSEALPYLNQGFHAPARDLKQESSSLVA